MKDNYNEQIVFDMLKRAIIIGATSGIGMEVAKLLAHNGWQVGIAGRRVERLKEVMRQSQAECNTKPNVIVNKNNDNRGGIVCYQQIDVTATDAPSRLLQLIDKLGGMDLYFHSSGIGWQNNQLDIEKEMKTMDTNGLGFVRMVDTAFNWFVQKDKESCLNQEDRQIQKFRIACITSIAGTKGLGAAPAYSSTKRFQNHYLECLAQQAHIRHLPIAITDIRPGFVKTDLIAGSSYPLQLDAKMVASHIVKAIDKGKKVKVIDWRYAILVALWQMIPRWLWIRLRITT